MCSLVKKSVLKNGVNNWNAVHEIFLAFCFFLLMAGMVFSTIGMSLGLFGLGLLWLLDLWHGLSVRKITAWDKIKPFFSNKAALLISSIFMLHILGLLYTVNFDYALKDLRIKIPLFVLPFIIATSPVISEKKVHIIILLFIAAIFVNSLISIYVMQTQSLLDLRSISVFVSHIRYSLYVCFTIFLTGYMVLNYHQWKWYYRALLALIILWLIVFLFIAEFTTGIAILFIITISVVIVSLFHKKYRTIKFGIAIALLLVLFFSGRWINTIYQSTWKALPIDYPLPTHTALGNPYTHDSVAVDIENGNRTWMFISWYELEEAWNKRARLKFNEHNKRGDVVCYTAVRYLSSKGFTKDAEGLNKLNDADIAAIETGFTNYKYTQISNLEGKIYDLLWELRQVMLNKEYNFSTIGQRFEYWRNAIFVIKKYPIIGVGTGDVNEAMNKAYEERKTKLKPELRFRAHNQYLSFGVAFGIAGILFFIFILVAAPIVAKAFRYKTFLVFYAIALLSMLTEDTIETQAGVTFFTFFMTFYLVFLPRTKVDL